MSATSRPARSCAVDDCTRLTRSAAGRCADHRPQNVPTVTRVTGGMIAIDGRCHTPAEALELANRLADALATTED
ncbi:hypothetical protein MP11Mi_16690 [Gordonia sp. MP11Mi]|uniref:Uncharacterized protein n=1 Tax=Gordonia sp. MP11Mi TaxID=3022769 RepID=A0AA97CWS7_9ACTN